MKIDITISRGATITLTNYRSVKPVVTLSLREVEAAKYQEAYDKLSKVADSMWALEFMKIMDEMIDINEMGPDRYARSLAASEGAIREDLAALSTIDGFPVNKYPEAEE
jgi:hypothetical protein